MRGVKDVDVPKASDHCRRSEGLFGWLYNPDKGNEGVRLLPKPAHGPYRTAKLSAQNKTKEKGEWSVMDWLDRHEGEKRFPPTDPSVAQQT